MSTLTFGPSDLYGPALVSELPPVTTKAPLGAFARLGRSLWRRRQVRLFERAVFQAGPTEHNDLLAASRRR